MTAPLVPIEVNLRGLPWMRLDTTRLLESDLWALSSGDEFKAAVALWCKSWTQVPGGSLPTDDRILAVLSGAGGKWKRVKAMALRGWLEADDGRLYHPVVAEQAIAAWEERLEYRAEVDSRNERKRRERAERAAMFEVLKAAGHDLAWNTPTGVLRDLSRDLSRPSVTPDSVTGHGDSHGLDGTGRDGSKDQEQEQYPAPLDPSPAPGAAGAICGAMRAAGLAKCNPGDQRLHDAIAAGCTTAEFVDTTREAMGYLPPKGFAWIVATTHGRRRDRTSGAPHAPARNRTSLADQVRDPRTARDDGDVLEGTATRVPHR